MTDVPSPVLFLLSSLTVSQQHFHSFLFVAAKTEIEFDLFKVARESEGPG